MSEMINVPLAFMIIASFAVATVLHEWAHAFVASLLGDHTPGTEGRQSLSLRAHLDPIGMLLAVVIAFQPLLVLPFINQPLAIAPAGIGWGKPVKPDPWKMRVGANTGVLLVACAGPLFSLLLGLLTGLLYHVLEPLPNPQHLHPFWIDRPLQLLLVFAATNLCIAIFNVLPLYPLDGYQILYTLLPSKQAVKFSRSAAYGPMIILALFFFVPFLANIVHLSDFPLFRIPYYIWLGAMALISLMTGSPIIITQFFYLH